MIKKVMSGVLALSVLALSGCGSKEKTTTCTGTNGMAKYNIELVSKDDKVLTMKQTMTVDMVQSGMDQSTLEEASKTYEENYGKLKGTTYKMDFKDDEASETITFDFNEADLDELSQSGMMPIDGEGANVISLEKTIENFESTLNLTCK